MDGPSPNRHRFCSVESMSLEMAGQRPRRGRATGVDRCSYRDHRSLWVADLRAGPLLALGSLLAGVGAWGAVKQAEKWLANANIPSELTHVL